MRIQQYQVVLDADRKNILVKESCTYYPAMDKLDHVGEIDKLMREVFEIQRRAEEYAYLICMNTKCKPVGFFEISHGTCDMAVVNPREILIRALLCGAAGFVLVHNHPGGDPSPSREDDRITKRLWDAAGLIGLRFLDHMIIGEESYYSYHMEKRLNGE